MSGVRAPAAGQDPDYCGLCGGPAEEATHDGGARPPSYAHRAGARFVNAHQACAERLQLEPPRFCGTCGRRLKVQVTPLGWSASCSRHGITTSAAAG
jgi:hypothetical protein